MKTARCPSCKSTGILVGYSSIPGKEVPETYLCLNCGGQFTVQPGDPLLAGRRA